MRKLLQWVKRYHPREATITLYYGLRRHLRNLLRLPPKAAAPVVTGALEVAVNRHKEIVERLRGELSAAGLSLADLVVCEIGAGDCLTTAAFCLNQGARQVHLVEGQTPALLPQQLDILSELCRQGVPVDSEAVLQQCPNGTLQFSPNVIYHQCQMEEFHQTALFDIIFSNSVLEHVEDVGSFFENCYRALRPGGHMVHFVDLGGHGLFEDPMPPLEFHIYPDWLFWLMCPPFCRATRHPVSTYVNAARAAGFLDVEVRPFRIVDTGYLEDVWPRLNSRIHHAGREEVSIIEFVLTARRA